MKIVRINHRALRACINAYALSTGLTHREIANRIGVSHTALRQWICAKACPNERYFALLKEWLESEGLLFQNRLQILPIKAGYPRYGRRLYVDRVNCVELVV